MGALRIIPSDSVTLQTCHGYAELHNGVFWLLAFAATHRSTVMTCQRLRALSRHWTLSFREAKDSFHSSHSCSLCVFRPSTEGARSYAFCLRRPASTHGIVGTLSARNGRRTHKMTSWKLNAMISRSSLQASSLTLLSQLRDEFASICLSCSDLSSFAALLDFARVLFDRTLDLGLV